MKKVCPFCGKTFETDSAHKKYCSDDCYIEKQRLTARERAEHMPKQNKQCPTCGVTFETTYSSKIYCSTKCATQARKIGKLTGTTSTGKKFEICKCPECGKEFLPKIYNQIYCSKKCSNHATNRKKDSFYQQSVSKKTPKFHLVERPKNQDTQRQKEENFNRTISEAEQCGLSYGYYTAMLRMGKTFEELRTAHLNELTAAQ